MVEVVGEAVEAPHRDHIGFAAPHPAHHLVELWAAPLRARDPLVLEDAHDGPPALARQLAQRSELGLDAAVSGLPTGGDPGVEQGAWLVEVV